MKFLSPVHCILRAVDNCRVSSTVHVTRLKRYVDPADRPIRQPLTDVDEPFLADVELPPDSFLPDEGDSPSSPPSPLEERTVVVTPPVLQNEAVADPPSALPTKSVPTGHSQVRANPSSSVSPSVCPETDEETHEDSTDDSVGVYQAEKIV